MQKSIWVPGFNSFECIPISEIVGSYGNSLLIFCVCGAVILISTVAASFYIATHSAQWVSFLHILVNTCISIFSAILIVSILMDVMWYLIMALIGISLMISDVEHLFMCLLVTCISFLEKYLFMFFTYFLIRLSAVFVEL